MLVALVDSVEARRLVDALLDVVEEDHDEDDDGRKVGHNPPEHFGGLVGSVALQRKFKIGKLPSSTEVHK